MRKKKLLLLGGSAQQVVAITTAKRLGYCTILCDYLPNNPGQYHADRFYQVSTTDKAAVLAVAQTEEIDGILAYASDPAAPTAAYVAEKMGLPTNSYKAVEILCNKDKFREFLSTHDFNTPKARGYERKDDAIADVKNFTLPIIVKPVDSSGSKGAAVIRKVDKIESAVDTAFSFSRSHRIIIEEFIEKAHQYLIGGDIFVLNGKVILWGLMNCHRDSSVNPLVPVGKSYPPLLDSKNLQNVKDTLQRLVTELGIRFGPMNVELIIDAQNRVFPIDIGPRSGGNMIPELLGMIFNCDVVEMSIMAAMGQAVQTKIGNGEPYYATLNLHSSRNGIFEKVEFTPKIQQYIIRQNIYKEAGDEVHFFSNAAHALGIVFFKFPDEHTMIEMEEHMNENVNIILWGGGGIRPKQDTNIRTRLQLDSEVGGMKKILLLGGSAQQIVAIKTAKRLGYYTVLCDFLSDNPGQYHADKFYLISTTDQEAVLTIARQEQINGVLAYASDPAAPTAAYVAEQMKIPGNPYESVDILCNKDKFRNFLSEHGFHTPYAVGYTDVQCALNDVRNGNFKLPVIVKPVDSSGSKGVSQIDTIDKAEEKIWYAMSFSRGRRIIVEEYVEKLGYQVAGDGLSINGKLVFRYFANDHFDPKCVNPFVPISASFPYNMPAEVQDKIHDEIQRLLSLLHMGTSTYNFDIRIDKDYNIYLMEIAPRSGGNYIPDVIKYAAGVDLVECSVKAAMGEKIIMPKTAEHHGFWAYYAVHSYEDGVLDKVQISSEVLKNNIVENHIIKRPGDEIKVFTGANTALGILIMKFKSMEEMLYMMDHSEKWIDVQIQRNT